MSTTEKAVWLTDKRWHDDHPELGTDPIPIAPYISDEQFELEREHIFGKVWLPACRVEVIPEPGDFYVKDVEVCRTSIVVTRGNDGEVRAFHNVCAHRGNKLAYDQSGNTKRLVCRFHGWAYDLEGALRLVPDEDNWFDLDKSCHGLTPVAVDVWEGFVFINLDPEPAHTLQEYLGEAAETLDGYPFAETSAQPYTFTTVFNANWKLVKDAFQEVAHVPFQHHGSLPDGFVSKDNPYTHFIDMRLYGPHGRASLFGNNQHVDTPAQALASAYGSTMVSSVFSGESEVTEPVGVNPTRSPDWAFEMTVFFPSFFLAVTEGTYFTNQFLPLDINRTLVETTTYYPRPRTLAQRFSQEYSRVMFRDIFLEDGRQVEETQSMLRSGAQSHFVLKDEELFIRASFREVERMIAAGVATSGSRQD
ncbi:MAG: hypothetical protein CME12_01105 [Gemmatimonadetes bacterium]|nr:hypothetical protein [Gemmatimonadota bacterium]